LSLYRLSGVRAQRGVGLIEVMISIVIGLLLVLVIYQVYEISEGQKRTITSGSDALQNASYGLYAIGRDLSMAGNGIASTATTLNDCPELKPIPVLIESGGGPNLPDKITVLYGGSPSLSTAVPFRANASGTQAYTVTGPVGFSAGDVIVAVQKPNCTISTINPGTVAVDPATGFSTISRTAVAGQVDNSYTSGVAVLVNLGQEASMGRFVYTVERTDSTPGACPYVAGAERPQCALRSQKLLPDPAAAAAPAPIINDVVNLKAQYGVVDANCTGVLAWKDPTGAWASNLVSAMDVTCVPPGLRQIQAIRIAIVTRSAQYEKDMVSPATLQLLCDSPPCPETLMNLSDLDRHYRYKVLETAIPLRNALWNTQ
jgi:type IV pilus assembly protein PilW